MLYKLASSFVGFVSSWVYIRNVVEYFFTYMLRDLVAQSKVLSCWSERQKKSFSLKWHSIWLNYSAEICRIEWRGGVERDPSWEKREEAGMQNETVWFPVWKWKTLIKYLPDGTQKMAVNSGMSQLRWELLSNNIAHNRLSRVQICPSPADGRNV